MLWACFVVAGCGGGGGGGGDDAGGADAPFAEDSGSVCAVDADCDDGFHCNGAETCGSDGACAAGAPPDCDDGEACTGDRCDETTRSCVHEATDADGDGHALAGCAGGDDCDDADADAFPGHAEVCDAAGHDEDCDPGTFGARDADGDGYADAACCNEGGAIRTCGDDCDDSRATVHPTEAESCDGADDDCDGRVDEGVLALVYPDADGDGFGTGSGTTACPTAGYALAGGDCDDADPLRSPGLTELCGNAIDDNCDGRTDESGPRVFFRDRDGDGFGDATDTVMLTTCDPPAGYSTSGSDCNDANAAVYPGAAERCNGRDDDCDMGGGVALAEDRDMDGHAPAGTTLCSGGPYLADDCNDAIATVHAGATELCDGLDTDCSAGGGAVPAEDADSDMHAPPGAACVGGHPRDDCDDTRSAVHPGAAELCDGLDTDCNFGGGPAPGEDLDGDGHAPTTAMCGGGPLPRDDCDDADAMRFPGNPEICDAAHDEDCNPTTVGSRDADADAHIDAACCNGATCGDDCDDTRATVYGGAPELCDGRDTDCGSGGGVALAEDADGDLHTATGFAMCTGGYPRDDCDDANPAAYPGAPLVAPLLLGPENGALSGSFRAAARGTLRPTFRWRPLCGAITYDIQVDDSCPAAFASCTFASPEYAATAVSATSARPATDLPVSTTAPVGRRYHWRVRACAGASCGPWSAVRYLDVGRAPKDVNGDGYSDIVVGAYAQNGTATGEGNALVYHGGAGGVPAAPSTTLENPGSQVNARFGYSVASAGDLDADGYADLVVAAIYQDVSGIANVGRAFVYLGGPGGVTTSPSVTLDNPSPSGTTYFGYSVASAGDVNGDGHADLVVGAPNQDAGAMNEGNAFLYLGGAGGVPATPSATLDNPANQAGGSFGAAVATGGDVNGDGYADLVVGAPFQDAGATNEGNAFVYLGGPSGVPAAPNVTLDNPRGFATGEFGASLATAGDVNGDGYADLVIGAHSQSAGAVGEGNAFVYLGGPSGVPAAPNVTLDNPTNETRAHFGRSVASGDVDGDGYVDVVVGADQQDAPATDEGNAFVYLGGPSGVPATPSATLDNPANQANGYFGASVASPGDVNADGYADVVVGAWGQDAGASNEGNAFVYHGGTSGVPAMPSATLDNPTNQASGIFGWSVASAAETFICGIVAG